MYRRRGQKPYRPRLRPAAEHSRAEQSRAAWRWHWSFSVVSLGCPDQGSVEREGEQRGRERDGEGGKAQLVIIIVANQAAQFRPAAVVIFTSPSCIIHWAAVIHTKCIHACHFAALARRGRGGMSPRGWLARCFPLANHGPGRTDHRRAK